MSLHMRNISSVSSLLSSLKKTENISGDGKIKNFFCGICFSKMNSQLGWREEEMEGSKNEMPFNKFCLNSEKW